MRLTLPSACSLLAFACAILVPRFATATKGNFTDEQRRQFEEEGYLIARNIVPQGVVDEMRRQIERIIERAAAGEFGDDFRWTHEGQRVPAFINDLLTPQKYDPSFGEFFGETIVPCVEELLGKSVRSSWLLLLTSGAGESYTLPLHRDNNGMGTTDEMELNERLHLMQCYFQAPLLPHDAILQLVPGSHLRPSTEAEVRASLLEGNVEDVEGVIPVKLEPGDVVFRSTNTLHRGWNPQGVARWTLVSGLWADDLPMMEIERQDREGISDPYFRASLHPGHQAAVERYFEAFDREMAAAH